MTQQVTFIVKRSDIQIEVDEWENNHFISTVDSNKDGQQENSSCRIDQNWAVESQRTQCEASYDKGVAQVTALYDRFLTALKTGNEPISLSGITSFWAGKQTMLNIRGARLTISYNQGDEAKIDSVVIEGKTGDNNVTYQILDRDTLLDFETAYATYNKRIKG